MDGSPSGNPPKNREAWAQQAAVGLVISLVAALSVAAFIFGFAALNDRQVLFGIHTGPGAFYKLMPHNAMALLKARSFLLK